MDDCGGYDCGWCDVCISSLNITLPSVEQRRQQRQLEMRELEQKRQQLF